jgi:hypothetical protein
VVDNLNEQAVGLRLAVSATFPLLLPFGPVVFPCFCITHNPKFKCMWMVASVLIYSLFVWLVVGGWWLMAGADLF